MSAINLFILISKLKHKKEQNKQFNKKDCSSRQIFVNKLVGAKQFLFAV
jgi:hypothetical protein